MADSGRRPVYYDSERALSEYLLFHYGSPSEVLPWDFGPSGALEFPRRCVEEMLALAGWPLFETALDLGCAVGRSSFELARTARQVMGIDFSRPFIAACHRLREAGVHPYRRTEEGHLFTELVARVPPGIDRTRVNFETGDACDLRPDLGGFDLVLMANLIDRLPRPRRLLARLPQLVVPGGHLIVTSPYTWLEEHTPEPEWLGGRSGPPPNRAFDTLLSVLTPHFELVGRKDLPFLIREHVRKFQWSVADGTIWRRHKKQAG